MQQCEFQKQFDCNERIQSNLVDIEILITTNSTIISIPRYCNI